MKFVKNLYDILFIQLINSELSSINDNLYVPITKPHKEGVKKTLITITATILFLTQYIFYCTNVIIALCGFSNC